MKTKNTEQKKLKRGNATPFTPSIIKYFRECFTYSKRTGILRWRKDRPARHFATLASYKRYLTLNAGTPAGTAQGAGGHLQVQFSRHPEDWDRRNWCVYVHRIAYALVTGTDPGAMLLDHRNGDTHDNRWTNLRLATTVQNSANRAPSRSSTTGVLGVAEFQTNTRIMYRAYLQIGVVRRCKIFRTIEAATEQRHAWERQYHGKFSAHRSRPQ